MSLSDEQWRFAVEEILGVTPAQCEAIVGRAERETDAARAIARNLLLRTMISGGASGLSADRWKTIPLLLIEERAALRQKALMRASLRYLDDRAFFLRRDWPQYALGLDSERRMPLILVRETIRFVARAVLVHGTRSATRFLPRPLSAWSCASVGAIFNAVEHTAFATRLLEARQARARRQPASDGAVVLPLPVRKQDGKNNATNTEERS